MNKKIVPEQVLEAAAQHMKNREVTYDSPGGERSMEKTVQMFNTLLGGDRLLTTEQGWLFMAILKIVRCQQGQFREDNYQDLAAYAALAAESAYEDRAIGAFTSVPEDYVQVEMGLGKARIVERE